MLLVARSLGGLQPITATVARLELLSLSEETTAAVPHRIPHMKPFKSVSHRRSDSERRSSVVRLGSMRNGCNWMNVHGSNASKRCVHQWSAHSQRHGVI